MNFGLYFNLGIEHITDLGGYDHILFIIAICAIYGIGDWKRVAAMVTAFTLGHSLSLALATLQLISVWIALIEFLIPLTILITCFGNIAFPPKADWTKATRIAGTDYMRYFSVAGFGLIHGLGFSTFLRATLTADETIFMPLLAFNIGLEAGQLLIVSGILLLSAFFLNILQKQKRDWNLFISGIAAGPAIIMTLERFVAMFANH